MCSSMPKLILRNTSSRAFTTCTPWKSRSRYSFSSQWYEPKINITPNWQRVLNANEMPVVAHACFIFQLWLLRHRPVLRLRSQCERGSFHCGHYCCQKYVNLGTLRWLFPFFLQLFLLVEVKVQIIDLKCCHSKHSLLKLSHMLQWHKFGYRDFLKLTKTYFCVCLCHILLM